MIKARTINGKEYLGIAPAIGSLVKGEIADLIILDKILLEAIQNSNSAAYTMINGRLYDTEIMNEIRNYDQPRTLLYWEQSRYSPSFDWHEAGSGCNCGIGIEYCKLIKMI